MNIVCRATLNHFKKLNSLKTVDFFGKKIFLVEPKSRLFSLFSYNLQKVPPDDLNKDSQNPAGYDYERVPQIEEILNEMSPRKMKKYLDGEKKYNGKLVYVGHLTRQLYTAKTLSLSSSLLGLMMLPFLSKTLSTSSFFSQLFVYGTTSFFIFVTPIFAQFMCRRYVNRMYYNYEEKKFKAILFSFFMFEYKLEFSLSDVYVPDLPGPFTTVKLKSSKRNLFIDLNTINDVTLVQKIYGYDKPFDVKKYTDKNKDDDDD